MEKGGLPTAARQAPPTRPFKTVHKLYLALLVFWLWLYFSDSPSSSNHALPGNRSKDVEWADIAPSKELVYHGCYGRYECARLSVPMNRNRTDGKGSKVHLAILKLPAKVDVTDPRYGGIILLNPGGPGGSGTQFLEVYGDVIQSMVDSPQDPHVRIGLDSGKDVKYFDIVSFDPRGVNLTLPHASCFETPLQSRVWSTRNDRVTFVEDIDTSFAITWARWKARNEHCSAITSKSDEDNIAEHMNTTPVVEDMVDIIEAHGAWREKKARTLLGKSKACRKTKAAALERSRYVPGEEKLLYWGFSYGTVLGATFAAMHPEKVSRLIIDGVVNTSEWYALQEVEFLTDTDAVFDQFFEFCYAAGKAQCPFYDSAGVSAMKSNFEKLLVDLKKTPVPSVSRLGPGVADVDRLKYHIFRTLYSPLRQWTALGHILSDLFYDKNGTSLGEAALLQEKDFACPPQQCKFGDSAQGGRTLCGSTDEAFNFIFCSEPDALPTLSFKEAQESARERFNFSKIAGADAAISIQMCNGWPFRPKARFPGPYGAKHTAHPLLILSNTLDPVTPLASARNVNKHFAGSVLVEQKSQAHCTISGAPGPCLINIVRDYFQSGKMPKEGTTCEPTTDPILGPRPDTLDFEEDHVRIMKALEKASNSGYVIGRPILSL